MCVNELVHSPMACWEGTKGLQDLSSTYFVRGEGKDGMFRMYVSLTFHCVLCNFYEACHRLKAGGPTVLSV